MKRIRLAGLLFVISLSLVSFVGCSKDDGYSPREEDLIGKWDAVKEEIDLTAMNAGKMSLVPGSLMFINMIVELKDDDTITYESWNGTDKTAAAAAYKSGDGSWSVDGTIFSLDFNSEDMADLEGTYKLKDKNTLEISTSMALEIIGEIPVPLKITLKRI